MSRRVVDRFVAGTSTEDALRVTKALLDSGRAVTLDHLGEDVVELADATRTVSAYHALLARLGDLGVGQQVEVSLKLSALGQAIDERIALDHAWLICAAASEVGTTVTLDMEDHTTTDSTLAVVRELRLEYPWVGAVLQAYLHRTESDCRDLATSGSRVRLCKGAYKEPASVAYQGKDAVADSYLRCLRILMEGDGYPMVASHDPAVVQAATAFGRPPGTWEMQMLHGIREQEQQRLADSGVTMRVYVPYGDDWYGYFMRRLAERPANVAFFLRALMGR